MLSLHTKEIVQPSMTPHKILQTYKRKRFSIHPDSLHVEKDNLSSDSPKTLESQRDIESTKQTTETRPLSVEISQNLDKSSEDLIKSQSPLQTSCGPKDISIRGKVDLGCPKKAPLRTFIRKSKRNLDAMVNNSNFEMQEGDKLPIPMKEGEICLEDNAKKSCQFPDEDKRIEESSLGCTERSESMPLASACSVLTDSALVTKEKVNRSSSTSAKDSSSEVQIHNNKHIDPADAIITVCPEVAGIMVNDGQQVTTRSISDEALKTQVSNLLLLCQACDAIGEDSTRQNKSHLNSVEVNAEQASNKKDISHDMSTGFSLPDLNAQVSLPMVQNCFQTHEETKNQTMLKSCGVGHAAETAQTTQESSLPLPEIRVLPSAPSVSSNYGQHIDQVHDFLPPWKAYNINNPPLYGHTQMLSDILNSSRIFNRRKFDFLTSPRSQSTAWSEEELDSLWIGVRRHGLGNWVYMLMDPKLNFFGRRTPEDLAKRWDMEQSALLNPTLTLSMSLPEFERYPNFFRKNGNRLPSGDFYFKNLSQTQSEEMTTVYPLVTNGSLVLGSGMYEGTAWQSQSTKPANVPHWLRGEVSTSDQLTLACGTCIDPKVKAMSQKDHRFLDLNLALPESMGSERMTINDGDSSEGTISDDQDSWH